MRLSPCDRNKILSVAAILLGVIILLLVLPFWLWLMIIGFALIVLGLLIFLKKC